MSSTAQSDASGGDVSTGDGSAGTATRRRGRGSGTGRASSGASTTPDAGAATSAPAAPPIRTAARAAADEAAGVAAASRAPLPAVPFANQHVVTCWGCNTRLGYTDLSLGLIACPKCGALTDSARAVAKREATLKANGIYRTQPLYRLFRIAPSVFTVAAVTAVIGEAPWRRGSTPELTKRHDIAVVSAPEPVLTPRTVPHTSCVPPRRGSIIELA